MSRLAAHKKSAAFIESSSNPDWMGDFNYPGLMGGPETDSAFADQLKFTTKRTPL